MESKGWLDGVVEKCNTAAPFAMVLVRTPEPVGGAGVVLLGGPFNWRS